MYCRMASRSAGAGSRRDRSLRRLAASALLTFTLLLPLAIPSPAAVPAPFAGPASLIYAGWYGNTIPTPTFVNANLVFLESQPFDGIVVYLRDPGLTVNVTTKTMTNTALSYETVMWVMSPLAGLSFTQLANNMGLIQGSTPPDFFDDWSIPIQNFANVAKAAKDSGLKGLCFDNEQYFSPWGNYDSNLKYCSSKTFAEYQAQARLRGKQVMEAMIAQFPDLVFLTLHGPYISEPAAPASLQFPQWQSGNELLGPFFAGLTEGAGSTACNMDGGELYTLRTADDFQASYTWRRSTIASDAVNCAFIPPALRTVWPDRSSISYGVYDCPFGGASMDATILRTTLANALRRADRYVWFYAEASTYLLPAILGGASDTWVDAIRLAKADAGTVTADPTATPLGAPANLTGQAVSSTEIALAWTDQSTAENGFSIDRLNGATWSQIGWVGSNVTTYHDAGVSPSTSYSYRVLAFNGTGNSPASNVVSVTTPSTAPSGIPAAPSTLTAPAVTASSVTLSWADGSSNENGFSIERLIGTTWTQVGWVGSNVTIYTNTGLAASTSYSYRVLAFNGYGNSPTSNVVSATTSSSSETSSTTSTTSTAPAAPQDVTAVAVSSTTVSLTWTDASSNESEFKIYRKRSGGPWSLVVSVPANTTGYQDAGRTPGITYAYRMRAENSAGRSPYSNDSRVTMPAAP